MFHFLMPYATRRPFVIEPAKSAFVDGEIALMLATRILVAPRADYEPLLEERLALYVLTWMLAVVVAPILGIAAIVRAAMVRALGLHARHEAPRAGAREETP